MIVGFVDASLNAWIPLWIEDAAGQTHRIDAIVDTGFTGFLCLPSSLISMFGLPWVHKIKVILADGSIQDLDVYNATIIWDTQFRSVRVHSVETDPLVGMKLLQGNELRIRVIPGGLVQIDVIP